MLFLMAHAWSDVRYALRALRRRPGFTAMALAILTLGIGANTAIFSVVNGVLLRSLPYRDVDNLMIIWSDASAHGMSNQLRTSPGTFLDWREQADVFSGLVAVRNVSYRITSVEDPVVPLVHAVSADYFDVLGVEPLHGRTFRPGEDQPGAGDVVVLAYGLWQSVFGGDPATVGKTITLDERPYTVVGVIKPDFYSAHGFAVQPGLWVPLALGDSRDDRSTRNLFVYGRLAESRNPGQAQAAMHTISARIAELHPETDEKWGARLVPLRQHAVGRFSDVFGILLAAVGVVLLIACANVANLTLARATERSRELALRTALGAGRSRIIVQLVTESMVLSLLGGLAGLALATLAVGPMASLIPSGSGVPFLDGVHVDSRVILFTFVLSLLAGIAFGLAPARQASRPDLATAFKQDGRSGAVGARRQRLRGTLVIAEVALAVVVVAAAGLMLQTFAHLRLYSPGYDAERILKLRTSLRGEEFSAPGQRIAHFEELQRRLASLPGVVSASAVSFEPPILAGVFGAVRIALPGRPTDRATAPSAIPRPVLPDYFETMGIPIVRGRGISHRDRPGSRRVAAISKAMAARYFSDRDPIGRTFSIDGPGQASVEIVGIVGDILTAGTTPDPRPIFYVPYTQAPRSVMSFVMRVPTDNPMALARVAEGEAWALSPSTSVYSVETLDQRIQDVNWRSRFGALLLGGFAALALLLGAGGIYAVISYSVAQRRGEIGVRMALGASRSDVAAMVVGDALRLALVGVGLGVLTSLVLTRLLAGLLYGVTPSDPVTFVSVTLLLVAVAVVASLAPALKATRIDPLQALRGRAGQGRLLCHLPYGLRAWDAGRGGRVVPGLVVWWRAEAVWCKQLESTDALRRCPLPPSQRGALLHFAGHDRLFMERLYLLRYVPGEEVPRT